jgi:serine/threonine-protein kinase
MNIDELKEKWSSYDRKLDHAIRLNEARVRMIDVRRSLSRVYWPAAGGLVVNGVAVMILGSFIAGHLSEPEFWIPALALHAFVVAHIAWAVRQLLVLQALDYSAPVVTIQRKLAALRLLRVRIVKWTLGLAPLLWAALLVVGPEAIVGLNVYVALPASYLAANLGFGLAFLAMMMWLARRIEGRLKDSPRLESLMDDLAGRSLTEAKLTLKEIADFEREASAV